MFEKQKYARAQAKDLTTFEKYTAKKFDMQGKLEDMKFTLTKSILQLGQSRYKVPQYVQAQINNGFNRKYAKQSSMMIKEAKDISKLSIIPELVDRSYKYWAHLLDLMFQINPYTLQPYYVVVEDQHIPIHRHLLSVLNLRELVVQLNAIFSMYLDVLKQISQTMYQEQLKALMNYILQLAFQKLSLVNFKFPVQAIGQALFMDVQVNQKLQENFYTYLFIQFARKRDERRRNDPYNFQQQRMSDQLYTTYKKMIEMIRESRKPHVIRFFGDIEGISELKNTLIRRVLQDQDPNIWQEKQHQRKQFMRDQRRRIGNMEDLEQRE